MKFGVFFPQQLPKPWAAGKERELFAHSLEQAELADRIGIDYAWAQEHQFLEEYSHSSAPEVFLAACTQRTQRIRLGHGVVLTAPRYNAPARNAARIATLDLISGGRIELGTGESASRIELEGFGIQYVDKRAMWHEGFAELIKLLCMDPYPGYQGRFFSMPARTVVPRPVQTPHPPLWMACSNRESLRRAARLGIGALTFAFMEPKEAKFWVQEYYETFERECEPIGRVVNPNVASLVGFMCHRDGDEARLRGLEGLSFFAWGLSHYLRTGTHTPGRRNLWQEFKQSPPAPMAGTGGIGSPGEVREKFAALEEAGVDQLILLQQSGNYEHSHICESLELFGKEVLPDFKLRDEQAAQSKQARLADAIARAQARVAPLPDNSHVEDVDAYPVMLAKSGVDLTTIAQTRHADAAALWRLHSGGGGAK